MTDFFTEVDVDAKEQEKRRRAEIRARAHVERLNLMQRLWRHIKANEICDEDGQLIQVDRDNCRALCERFGWDVPEIIDEAEQAAVRPEPAKAIFKKEFTKEELAAIEERRRTLLPPT